MYTENNDRAVERVMDNAFTKMRNLIDVDAVVGTPITTVDGVSIVPISKVTMGFLTGGGEYSDMLTDDAVYPFAGGSGAGAVVTPTCFLVSDGANVRLISVDEKNPYEKLLELVPIVVDKIVNNKES